MKVELKKCSIHDYKHCVDVGENVRKRLKDGKLWGKDDYDLTLWGNRGGGRAQLVAYRRRMAARDLRSDSLSILRVVQNKTLVSFLIKNSYRCAQCIPYTQLTVSESGNGCFAVPERNTHWLAKEKFSNVSKETEHERTYLQMIDLAELKFWGEFGRKWKSGLKYNISSKIIEKSKMQMEKTDEKEDVVI